MTSTTQQDPGEHHHQENTMQHTITCPDRGVTVVVKDDINEAYREFYRVCDEQSGAAVWIADEITTRAGRTADGRFL